MRVLVCGGRDFADSEYCFAVLSKLHARRPITVIIEGGATGADRLGEILGFRSWNPHHHLSCQVG